MPAGVIVPKASDPPGTPSTSQVTLSSLVLNCCVRVNVSATARGLTENPLGTTSVPAKAVVAGAWGAVSEIVAVGTRAPVALRVASGSKSTLAGGVAAPEGLPFLSQFWLVHPGVFGLHHPGWVLALISSRLVPAIPSESRFSTSANGGFWQIVSSSSASGHGHHQAPVRIRRCCRDDPYAFHGAPPPELT
jgi:hypothetical protein